jgi:hypothetical protein
MIRYNGFKRGSGCERKYNPDRNINKPEKRNISSLPGLYSPLLALAMM